MALYHSRLILLPLLVLVAAACSKSEPTADASSKSEPVIEAGTAKQIIWAIDNTESIAGHPTEVMGEPQLIDTAHGNAVEFDGDEDRLLVANNPLFGAAEFTIEMVFRANDVHPNNAEPRVVHIESEENPNQRVTIELRLNDKQQWYLDAFIKSDVSNLALIDETLTHSVEEWFHVAITYKDRLFTTYVNGVKELSAEVEYQPISDLAKTSIGSRMNKVHWFNGAISHIAITHRAMQPNEFAVLNLVNNAPGQ